MNLGKRASLNINSRTKLLQVQLKICSRFLVLFPICYCFAGNPQFSSSKVKHYETVQLQFTSYTFVREKLGEKLCFVVFSRWMSARQLGKRGRCKLQAASAYKGGNFGTKLTHLCGFWSDLSFLSHVKKHRSFTGLIERITFFTSETHRSLLWLARNHLRMNFSVSKSVGI